MSRWSRRAGWGGGNTGRNTTIIRSNYLYDESAALYNHAMKMWDGLSQELNYNIMYSARGVMMLAHNVHDVQGAQRHIHANQAERRAERVADARAGQGILPAAEHFPDGALSGDGRSALQRCGGNARHDAVAWGYARGAADRGVDIIQNCAVTGIRRAANGAVEGVETTPRLHRCERRSVSLPPATARC